MNNLIKCLVGAVFVAVAFIAGVNYENWRIYDKCLTDNTRLVDVYIIGLCGNIVK